MYENVLLRMKTLPLSEPRATAGFFFSRISHCSRIIVDGFSTTTFRL